ncbi:hypothetical protein [Bacillus sp. FSL K6-2839]|uniref:hypothetical protein n=1 Tax=Bacillus sp. FSL K6-2839 TaxID=2921480 RepID=UPI0030F6A0DB
MKLTHEDLKQINSYFNNHSAYNVSGFVKEHVTGNIYPYTDVNYRKSQPYELVIIKENKKTAIPYEKVSVIKF